MLSSAVVLHRQLRFMLEQFLSWWKGGGACVRACVCACVCACVYVREREVEMNVLY